MSIVAVTNDLTVESPAMVHAPRSVYRDWVDQHYGTYHARWNRLHAYDEFVGKWPQLMDWFQAPLQVRLFDTDHVVRGNHPHGGASVIMPYLTYLSLVRGVALDYGLLLGRQFASPFTTTTFPSGLGVDHELFADYCDRLQELGYRQAQGHLKWALGRMMLHRGDPDTTHIEQADFDELTSAVFAFSERLARGEPLREFYSKVRQGVRTKDPAASYRRTATVRIQAAHVLMFDRGQLATPPAGRVVMKRWEDDLLPEAAPPRIRAVVERYLQLYVDARTLRRSTLLQMRDALRRFVYWLSQAHPEMSSLADLKRGHAEEFLSWLGQERSKHTGKLLVANTRRQVITSLTRFVTETAAWNWEDVPGRVVFTRADNPKTPRSMPRFIPGHELTALMEAVERLPDPYQRAALIVARWSGARRDEIRRLTVDCLDTYPDGHPRLRLPVGKGYSERMIPLHPEAAAALQPLIDQAKTLRSRPHYDHDAEREVTYVFTVRGKLLSQGFLFDAALKAACTAAGLVDDAGRPTISAHRFRHTIGTQLAEGGARLQTIMAILGHRTPAMSLIYASMSDPTVKAQYQAAISGHESADGLIAGPAAAALREYRLDPEAVSWLQTNFLKTELELGHCLRLPQEGPCECDLVLTCSKFLTTKAYAPRLQERLATEVQLIEDAKQRGWPREVERHQATYRRIEQLLTELGQTPTSASCANSNTD